MLTFLLHSHHLHRDVTGRRILFQMVQNSPAEHIRQKDIQRDGSRPKFARQ